MEKRTVFFGSLQFPVYSFYLRIETLQNVFYLKQKIVPISASLLECNLPSEMAEISRTLSARSAENSKQNTIEKQVHKKLKRNKESVPKPLF